MSQSSQDPNYPLLGLRTMSLLSHLVGYAHLTADLIIDFATASIKSISSNPDIPVKGRHVTDVFYEFVGAEAQLEGVLNGQDHEFHIKHINRVMPDGTVMYYDFYIHPYEPGNPSGGLVFIIEDQTETSTLTQAIIQQRNQLHLAKAQLDKANEELVRLNRLKSLFVSMAAHDLRSPLGVIVSYMDLIGRKVLNEETEAKFVQTVKNQAQWLNRLIGDILDLEMIEQGMIQVDRKNTDLNLIIEKMREQLETMMINNEINLHISLPQTPSMILCDEDRIMQIVYNLVGNARKFTPSGGTISVDVHQSSADQTVQLTVKDTGRGIAPERLPHLFTIYYRNPDTLNVKGTGIGLFIVKTLVTAHEGSIEVESIVDVGTTFTITFPLLAAAV